MKTHSFLIKVEIIEGHIMPDYIHLLLSIPPKYSVSSLWDIWKGKVHWWYLICIQTWNTDTEIDGNRKFCAKGYYVSTLGLNESTIRKYIREQESHDVVIDKLTTKEYTNPFGNKKIIDKPF